MTPPMLKIPLDYRIAFSEFLCSLCSEPSYAPAGSGEKLFCMFCGGESKLNGDFEAYIKEKK